MTPTFLLDVAAKDSFTGNHCQWKLLSKVRAECSVHWVGARRVFHHKASRTLPIDQSDLPFRIEAG